jgi:copper chaperone CopZ
MITETIKIEGMSCAGACVRSVKQALSEVEGIEVAEVGLGFAKVTFDPETDAGKLTRRAIAEVGFRAVN